MNSQERCRVQPTFARRLRISVAEQRLDLLENGAVVRSYPVSTSRFGLGSEAESFRTPLGEFVVEEMIGAGAPKGAIFRGRRFTGEIAAGGGDEDLVLTRILWLGGCDPGNANTRDRYIYIHGTNQEDRIGTAASHGCIRMRNADIAELFEFVEPGTPVTIEPPPGLALSEAARSG